MTHRGPGENPPGRQAPPSTLQFPKLRRKGQLELLRAPVPSMLTPPACVAGQSVGGRPLLASHLLLPP